MDANKYLEFDPKIGHLNCSNEWILVNLTSIRKEIEKIDWQKQRKITIDVKNITQMDTAGAWFLSKLKNDLTEKKLIVHVINISDQFKKLISFVKNETALPKDIPKIEELGWLQRLGKFGLDQLNEAYIFINFIGALFFESIRVFREKSLWRFNTIASVVNNAGMSALPIIALLAFMIGIVISYQMGNQLKNYGANIFIVNLVGYSVLREFAPLLTAIIVAGRTGSAFTAHFGLMKVNREIDALDTLGIRPNELLIIPRIIALFIVMPLLTIWADIFGVIGGMLMAQNTLGVSGYDFLTRFQHEIPLRSLLIGIGKAPVFALIIASVSCFQGMLVKGSAESIGERTTRSVVLSIFFIIIVDAIFSILLSHYKL